MFKRGRGEKTEELIEKRDRNMVFEEERTLFFFKLIK
jgi:hypothetical protein